MRINEVLSRKKGLRNDLIAALKDFLPLCCKELKIDKVPHIKLCLHVPDDHQPTFGKFVNKENKIYLGIEDRHPIDILRTLAHELVHFKQFLKHELKSHSGETGSPQENEGHVKAGIIMRHFDKKFPHYFLDQAVDIEEGWKSKAAGAALVGAVGLGLYNMNHKSQEPQPQSIEQSAEKKKVSLK